LRMLLLKILEKSLKFIPPKFTFDTRMQQMLNPIQSQLLRKKI